MYAPKEAREDFGLYWIAIAVFIAVGAAAFLGITFQSGLTYFMLQRSSVETVGLVVGRDVDLVTYSYTDEQGINRTGQYKENSLTDQKAHEGDSLILSYNPGFPHYIYPKSQLEFIEIDFYFTVAAIIAILVAVLITVVAFVLHLRFIKRMRNY